MVPKTQKGRYRLPLKLLLLTTALTGVGVWMVSKPGSNPFTSSKSVSGQQKATVDQKSPAAADRRQAEARPAEEESIRLSANGTERSYKLALDEVAVKKANGEMHSLRLSPPATRETLAARISDLKQADPVYPVCYPEGVVRNQYTRSIITPDITVKMLDGQTELPSLPEGLEVKERPSYAPDKAVLRARDSFAALKIVEDLKTMSTLALAEVQLAVQLQPRGVPTDPLFGSLQWNLKQTAQPNVVAGTDLNLEPIWGYPIALPPAIDLGFRGKTIRVAVIDDGLETSHPEFIGNIDTTNDVDYNENDGDPTPKPNQNNNHGTSVGGIIASRVDNAGVVGVAPEATMVGFRLIGAPTTDSQEGEAMNYLNDGANLVQIKNNSWGPTDLTLSGPGPLALDALIRGAAGTTTLPAGRGGKGTIYVFAAGNGGIGDNSNYDGWANSIYTIAVGAMASDRKQASYSERGSNIAVVAPSDGVVPIATTDRVGDKGYVTTGGSQDYNPNFGGTSAAAPAVSGVIALMLQANPNLGYRDVKEILMRTATAVDSTNAEWQINGAEQPFAFNPKYGAGLVNATAAVNTAKTWVNLGPMLTSTKAPELVTPVGPIPDNNVTGRTLNFNLRAVSTANKSLRVEHATVDVKITHPRSGDLEIYLESPRGTRSKLAERHKSGFNYEKWTFSTVQNWGENSVGMWKLVIKDRVGIPEEGGNIATGTITAATLTLYGAAEPPKNPPPLVTITSPLDGASYSPNPVGFEVTGTVTDQNKDNLAGVVKELALYDNGAFVAKIIPTAAVPVIASPYKFSYTPGIGTHVFTVKATDTENASRIAGPVTVTVANRPPTINYAEVTPAGQTYYDNADVGVTSLVVSDPESDEIVLSYQWQRSTDTFTYVNVPSQTGPKLTPDLVNAGYMWRCVVAATDKPAGNRTTFVTNAVNILNRPQLTVAQGANYSYNSGLIIRSTDNPLLRQVIINEFSQGSVATTPYTSSEWIELLTLKAGSLRSWRLTDTAGNQLALTNNAVWDNIPAGTVIVIYNGGAPKDLLLPADDLDPSDKTLLISTTNTTYFVQGTYWPGFGNGGDSVVLRNSNFEPVSQFSYGSDNSTLLHFDGIDTGAAIQYTGNTDAGNENPANWRATTSLNTRSVRAPGDVPLKFGGPWNQPLENMEFDGTTVYYASLGGDATPGSAQFDTDGDQIIISFTSPAQLLSYTISASGNGPYGTVGQFLVMEGKEGANPDVAGDWTIVRTFTNKNYAEANIQDNLKPDTRKVRFLYNDQTQGTILLDKLAIYPTNPLFLTVTPTTFSEGGGPSAAFGQVSLIQAAPVPVTIEITSSDETAATVPATVVIPAGQSAVSFQIAAVDDFLSDGLQTADITVSSTDYTSNSVTVLVTDDEPNAEGVTPKVGNSAANIAWINALRDGSLIKATPFRQGAGSSLPPGLSLNTTTGVISGQVAADAATGPYNIVVERYNTIGGDPGEIVSVSFVLTVTEPGAPSQPGGNPSGQEPGSTLATYSNSSNGSDPGTIDTADLDSDGLGDLAEYYLGSNPSTNDASEFMPVVESNGTSVSMTYRRSNMAAQTVQGTVEWTNTLLSGPWSTVGVSEVILEQNTFWTKIRATVQNPSPEAKKYLRLRVEPKQL